jgi:hypothetical protein
MLQQGVSEMMPMALASLVAWAKTISSWGPSRPVKRRPTARPRVEALEMRWVPADIFTWKGGTVGSVNDYFTKANWTTLSARNYPGAGGVLDDYIVFDNTATTDCTAALTATLTVRSVELKANFANKFELSGNFGLNIVGAAGLGNRGTFTLANGALNLKNQAWLDLQQTVGTWSKGDLSKDGDAGGKIYLSQTSTLTIRVDATNLGATLVIGQTKTGADSLGRVRIGGGAADVDNLANNVTLYKNANLEIHPSGILELAQSANSATRGGIAVGAGSTSAINNQGNINRTVMDSGNQILQITPKVTNTAASANVTVGATSKIKFVNGLDVTQGKYTPRKGSEVQGVIKLPRGGAGKVQLDDGGLPPGTYDVYFDDDLIVETGSIEFGTTPGVFFTIHIGGQLVLLDEASVSLNVDGSAPGSSDAFEVQGPTVVDSAALQVTTQNQSPPDGSKYIILYPYVGLSGAGWGPLTFAGYPASYFLPDPTTLVAYPGAGPLHPRR